MYYGPYQILHKVGPVTYKLSLPPYMVVHYTFHVSQLKSCCAIPTHFNHHFTVNVSSPNYVQPKEILERRMIKRGNKTIPHILVQWGQMSVEDTTWEDNVTLRLRFFKFFS